MHEIAAKNVALKRAYEHPAPDDGIRILVDRLWPRGLEKTKAKIDRWFKEIAPSAQLRRWFGHEVARWEEFQRRYQKELEDHLGEIEELRALAREKRITLIFAARDEVHNEAIVLREVLLRIH